MHTWAEDFIRWLRVDAPACAPLFEAAQKAKEAISMPEGDVAADVKLIFGHLRYLMISKESKLILKNVFNDNALEAWRRLNTRYDPQTTNQRGECLKELKTYQHLTLVAVALEKRGFGRI